MNFLPKHKENITNIYHDEWSYIDQDLHKNVHYVHMFKNMFVVGLFQILQLAEVLGVSSCQPMTNCDI